MKVPLPHSLDMSARISAIRIVVREDPRLMEFIFSYKFPALREKPEILLKQVSEEFTRSERLLIRSAIDIWCGSGGILLNEILDGLGSEELIQLISGVLRLRGLDWEWIKDFLP